MKPYWRIDGSDIDSFQGDSPGFVRLLNALLAHQAAAGGVPQTAVHLNLKDNEPDGGVDAVIDSAIPRDPTGRFAVPTLWQFKAMPTGNIAAGVKGGQPEALRLEIQKPYSQDLIRKGYGYRLCIAADMPAVKKSEWEECLLDAAKAIRPDASPPMVLTASDIANWATPFRGAIAGIPHPDRSQYRDLGAWKAEITRETPWFVEVAGWAQAVAIIRHHVDFSHKPASLLTIHGEAGVGKTRCVYQALEAVAGIDALVVYTADEVAAREFANTVARDPRARAVLVADECEAETRQTLVALQRAHPDRLRILAIDNSLQSGPGSAGEVRLTRITEDEVETILERNFPGIIADRRRAYVALSRGFVRLAGDLCAHDSLVPPDGNIGGLHGYFRDYLTSRLNPAELDAVLLVALLARVGFKDDVASELDSLCAIPAIKLDRSRIVQAANRIRQSPGFIAFAGRFLYITPDLIARVAFGLAWEKWIAADPAGFFCTLPEEAIEPFLARVQSAGDEAMRQEVTDFFLGWAHSLAPPDLGDPQTVGRLVRLVEAEPGRILPVLARLVEDCPVEDLRRLHAGYEAGRGRRSLMWLLEKLIRFPEWFLRAERILLRLALAETEPQYGNNASRIWSALFRPRLSGTAVPFSERLALLERRLRTHDTGQLVLGIEAIDEILGNGPVMGLAHEPVLFGRVPPRQWQPANRKEFVACRQAALGLCARLASEGGPLAERIRRAVVKHLPPLLVSGWLTDVRAVLGDDALPDPLLADVLRELERFFDYYGSERREIMEPVRRWHASLVPQTSHGRLVAVVGQNPWHQQLDGDKEAWRGALGEVARELLLYPERLEAELPWLASREARSAFQLGRVLAQQDSGGQLLTRLLDTGIPGGTTLARGYLDGLKKEHPLYLPTANALLDQLEQAAPDAAYEVLWAAGDEYRQFDRLLRMIDTHRLPADRLRALEYGIGERALTVEELRSCLERLLAAEQRGEPRAIIAAVHLLYGHLHREKGVAVVHCLRADDRLPQMLHSVLDAAFTGGQGEPGIQERLLEDLAEIDGGSAARLAASALANNHYNTRDLAADVLARLAVSHPEATMRELGAALLDRPGVPGTYAEVVAALPIEVIGSWLDAHGLDGAQAIARHLPAPHVAERGEIVVPPATALVLERFADDDKTYRNFNAGARSLNVRSGDLAAQAEAEARLVERFLDHPLRHIRQWASDTAASARREAAMWRQDDEEYAIPR